MKILKIDHIQLAMPAGEEDVATSFYDGVLGLTRVAKPEHLARRGGCWFESADVKIHLGVEEGFTPARKAHPALLIDDLDALGEKLLSFGYQHYTDQPLEGYKRFYANDPFGNRIEFLEVL